MKIKRLEIHTKQLTMDIECLTFQNGKIIRNVEAYLSETDIRDMVNGMLTPEKKAFRKYLNKEKGDNHET